MTSISAIEYFERNEREDSDGTSTVTLNIDWYSQIYQFSQEFRLTGELDNRWRYVLGAYYEHDDVKIKESWNFSGHPFAFTPILGFPVGTTRSAADFEQTLDSFAGFFHNEFDLTDSLTITGGLRYTADITEITGQTFFGNGSSGDENTVTPVVIVDSRDGKERFDDNISFKLGTEWQPVNDWLFYGSLSTGYRSGGFSAPFGDVISSFEPEEIFAQEVGIKARLFNNHVQWNSAAFHYRYEDAQLNVDIPGTVIPRTQNAGDIGALGFESDLRWSLTRAWDIQASIGYLDAEIDDSEFTIAGVPIEGNRPVNAPEWSFHGLLRYQRPVTSYFKLTVMTDYSWIDDHFYEVTNNPSTRIKDYWLLNAKAALTTRDDQWELSIWGKNVTDTEYLTYINDISPLTLLTIYGEPATYGITLRYNLNH